MISFFAVIFLLVAVILTVIFNLFDFCLPDFFLVTFYRFYQQAVFYQAYYSCWIVSYDIGVELFVVSFSFCRY